MAIEIREAKTEQELREFARLAINLYKDCPYYVPQITAEEVATLSSRTNPAFDFCEATYFIAYDSGKAVGRIAAIINHKVNKINGQKKGRFGFVDFTNDSRVSSALFTAAEDWLRSRGMNSVCGPMGFTDMDPEGLLVEGFDQMGTMITIYNHAYYPQHIEALGYRKEVDWLEYKIMIPESIPDKHRRISDIVRSKLGLRVVKCTSAKKLIADYGHSIFELLNQAYADLYGYSPLSERQIDYYIRMYLPMIRLDHVTLIVNEQNQLISFGIAIPSLSKAMRKANGKLFPIGFLHLLKALRMRNKVVDLLLIAVHPSYQNKGVNALLFSDLIPIFNKRKYEYAESNPELEENTKVQTQWQYFERLQHKRRRAFIKML